MTRRRKIMVAIAVALLWLVIAAVVNKKRTHSIAVQVGKVSLQDLSSVVTASGEIRPRHYVNITSQTFGKIVAIEVTEGSQVQAGQVLLRMEAAQPAAGVAAQNAMVKSAQASVAAAEANQRTVAAEVTRSRADFERARLDWERAQQLFEKGLIPQADHELRRSAFESAQAAVVAAEERVSQAAAELNRSNSLLLEARAGLSRSEDELHRTIYMSPIDGVVTSLPVHVGEQMVPGIQNSPGSYLMTVADMSGVTAEVRVDESDVLDVKAGQSAEVTVDAYPDSTFKGSVTEVGTTALLRSTGQSTTQITSGSQEAKDFKVVVALEKPPSGVRPGLSATARITTASRQKALSIPIQALTMRRQADIDAAEKARDKGKEKEQAAATTDGNPTSKKEVQGVFVVKDGRAIFHQVKTGITGVTDIEVTEGLKEGDEIVTGSYQVLRELKHRAKVRKSKTEEKKTSK
jgi:HlyD family secretion protein